MKSINKHIVLITPLLDHGGGQRYIANLSNYWVSLDYTVTIILLRSGESFFTLSDKIEVKELNYCNKNTINRIFTGLIACIKLRRILKDENPNFVLSILSSTNIFTLISTRFLNVRVFVRDAMSPFRKRSRTERYLRKLLYKKADGVILMTKIAKEFVEAETGVTNVKVIHNPVSHVNKFDNIKKEKIVITVGRLTSVKSQHFFLEACAKVNRPDWKFVILGEGELREDLNKKITSLGIENRVTMPGAVKNVDVWLNKSMIFVSTSVSEAWGNAICEAMAVGLPVVSFNCDVGPKEIIDDTKNGFLVPLNDVEELSLKIEKLMNDESLRKKIGDNAMLKMQQLNIETISKEVLDFCLA
ncbi:glycosyltransferase family 4 protein [Aureibaculum sp. A20]|uniref:Glycosyltransferase family 4 protein n=1 Tax=Aureibaculum flavum TaxID=2795986 RepID=A0ABS0WKZ6_9FLAO|nr:glycosyltransferase family 4 protein [Aureibaculum flavum]MBJ2172623.1 glycosyltransferase family 4 protein [Aureibaculum flavum]